MRHGALRVSIRFEDGPPARWVAAMPLLTLSGMRAQAGALGAIAALVAGLITGAAATTGPHNHAQRPETSTSKAPAVVQPPLPAQLPNDRRELAAEIDRGQQIIEDPSSSSELLTSAGRFEQLATAYLERLGPRPQRATLAMLGGQAAMAMHANLAAATVLSRLVTPRKRLPPWRVVQPPAPATLLGYFKTAQARFGVPWEDLAAIEFIETKFGRVHGVSTAGAQGPMQFLPATWARYGSGNIHDPRNAIVAAARYLRASGAPAKMAEALYHYNPSAAYVHAVQDYAGQMRVDGRSFYGYYNWQVLYAYARGEVILPVGYPRATAIPVRYPR